MKTAFITGAASGIGLAIAQRLAAQGNPVALCDINSSAAQQAVRRISETGGCAVACVADVSDQAAVDAAVLQARSELGPLGILVHAAGICTLTPFAALDPASFDRTIAVHLRGAYLTARAVVNDMLDASWGRIVNITSVAGLNGGGAGLAHYAAAKGGIIGFTKALAHELAPRGITVNAIAPGLIDTPMVRGSGMPDSVLAQLAARMPVGRIGQPEDIATACAFLVSADASFITGQVISPNGGAYM